MMKFHDLLRLIFIVGVLYTGTSVRAQEGFVVKDDFQTNNHYWPEGDFGYAKVKWSKSLYTIERTLDKGESVFTIDNYIDPTLDFSMETTLQITGSEGGFGGLVWNYADINNFDAFSISSHGTYSVVVCRYGEFFNLSAEPTGDPFSEAIKKEKWNRLKVERRGNFYHYFINDVAVFKAEFPGYAHPAHGFYITKRTTIKASEFKVKQGQVIHTSSDFVAQKEKLGMEINTNKNESSPLISPDGSLLFFTRSEINSHDADAWVSRKNKEGQWDKAERLGSPINNKVHNSVLSCAADNRSILLLNTYFSDGSYKGCCFSQSQRGEEGTWNLPQDVNIQNINHYGKWLDASLSADNTTMLLSALRPGTLGYNDLYVSFKTEKGLWSEPLNLGGNINTPFNEGAPFLASDNKTLYFSSLGYPGYGNQDIFMSMRLDDSWTRWSPPINLGPSVNTEGFDAFFSIASNDPWAYLVSNKEAVGGTDIFRIQLPSSLLPKPVCVLSGKVIDKSTNAALQAKLVYQSLRDDKVKGVLYSDPKTGGYQIILPDTGTYYISAEKKNYYGQADTLSFSYHYKASIQQQLNLYLDPLVTGKSFSIRQLQFEQSKAVLLPSSIPALKQLAALLNAHQKMTIRIEGHTDNVGDPDLNMQLSLSRADAVYHYLMAQGIEKSRMEVKGYGGMKPIADNAKEETRRLNRRVEFVILVKE